MMKTMYALWAFCAMPFLYACSEDEETALPTITVSDIERKSVVINGTVPETEDGTDILECGIYWSETNREPTDADKKVIAERDINGNFRIELTNLKGGTTYYAKGFAQKRSTTVTGETVSFTTLAGVPELSILQVTMQDEFDVMIKDLGGGEIKEIGYCRIIDKGNISDDFMPDIENSERIVCNFSSLNQDMTRFTIKYRAEQQDPNSYSRAYYYGRVYIITDNGIGYSQRVRFWSHLR